MTDIDVADAAAPAPERPGGVAILGMGYVGLPTALGLHEAGVPVIGIDHSERRLSEIRAGDVDLIDADQRRLDKALRQEDFQLTADPARLADADAVMVCVPTPVDGHRLPDIEPLRSACRTVVEHARPGQTLILTSTSYVGTTEQLLVAPLRTRGLTAGAEVFVASSPERIDPGNVTHTQQETPRVVGGVTPECAARAVQVIKALTPKVHVVTSPEAAEMTKLLENSFRAVNIALANEFADICEDLALDPLEITRAAATKPYGFMAFQPGPGVGGHCIPCDPHYLLWQLRAARKTAPLVDRAMTAIADRPGQVVNRVLETLSRAGRGLAGTRILIVGVAYKPGVRDVRSSSALDIIDLLSGRGAEVGFHDALVPEVRLADGSVAHSMPRPSGSDWDLVLIHTVHPGHDHDWIADCPLVVDTTYRLWPAVGAAAGRA
ncbi:MAG: nucleotide sugar dehydrogenase [Catenulispora sp.]|nr:nucleotide sugar dehydrogenase [Catenulispora sp.]